MYTYGDYPYMPGCPGYNYPPTLDLEDYMKYLLRKLKGYKVDILVNSRDNIYKNLLILDVEDGVVLADGYKEVLVIPIKDISTIFIPKSLAKNIFKY